MATPEASGNTENTAPQGAPAAGDAPATGTPADGTPQPNTDKQDAGKQEEGKQADGAAPADAADKSKGDKPGDKPADDKGAKPEDDKKGEKAGAPESYSDFTLPEGVALDPEVMGEFKAAAKELNLPQDAAQKLADIGAKMTLKNAQAMDAKLTEVKAEWKQQAAVDKEFGGDKYEASKGAAATVFQTFGTPALKDLLESSGLGDHPEMIRWAYRVSKAISPDTVVIGRQPSAPEDPAKKLYPNQK